MRHGRWPAAVAGLGISAFGCSLLVSSSDYSRPDKPGPASPLSDGAAPGADATFDAGLPARLALFGGEPTAAEAAASPRPGLEVGVTPLVDGGIPRLVRQPAAGLSGAHLLAREHDGTVMAISPGVLVQVAPIVGEGLGEWTVHKLSAPPNGSRAVLAWAGDFLFAFDERPSDAGPAGHFVASFDPRTLTLGEWQHFDVGLTLPLTDRAAAVVGEWLFFVGGRKSDNTPSADIEIFSVDTRAGRLRGASRVATMPTAIDYPCVTATDTWFYVLGSNTILVADIVAPADPPLGAWRAQPPFSTYFTTPPSRPACAAYDGHLYWTTQPAASFQAAPLTDAGLIEENDVMVASTSDFQEVGRGRMLVLAPR